MYVCLCVGVILQIADTKMVASRKHVRAVLTCTHNLCFKKKKKKKKKKKNISTENFNFNNFKNLCILHGRE